MAEVKLIISAEDKFSTIFDKCKTHWFGMTAAITASLGTVYKAIDFAKLGASALQAEESFKNVTSAYRVHADMMLQKMKEISAGILDNSELMQRAVRSLQQGLSQTQIVQLLEVARSSARVAGIDIASAFDQITTATANQTTRGLKSLGIVIDQGNAFKEYAKSIGKSADQLTELEQSQALANLAIIEGQRQMKAMGEIAINANEAIQKISSQWHEIKEKTGKEILTTFENLWKVLKAFPEGVIGYFKNLRTEMDKTKDSAVELTDPSPWQKFWIFMGEFGQNILYTFEGIFNSLGDIISLFVMDFIAVFQGIWDMLKGIGNLLIGIFTLDVDKIKKSFKEVIEDTPQRFFERTNRNYEAFSKGIYDTWTTTAENMQSTFDNAYSNIREKAKLPPPYTPDPAPIKTLTDVFGALGTSASTAKTEIKGVAEAVADLSMFEPKTETVGGVTLISAPTAGYEDYAKKWQKDMGILPQPKTLLDIKTEYMGIVSEIQKIQLAGGVSLGDVTHLKELQDKLSGISTELERLAEPQRLLESFPTAIKDLDEKFAALGSTTIAGVITGIDDLQTAINKDKTIHISNEAGLQRIRDVKNAIGELKDKTITITVNAVGIQESIAKDIATGRSPIPEALAK
ncbi:MAG: hypothetical protein HY805_00340 [Nitrospirae bacterium]|nr:hypothetical protein [Nitrospirota bacterium]